MKPKQLQALAWGTSIVAVVLAVVVWGQDNNWEVGSTYQLFPLFGLVAFSLMWGHYIAAAARLHFKLEKSVLKNYFEVTSLAVLAAILLHPGLLAWQLWKDGLGLPPASELNYVAESMKASVILGMTALVLFLAYELRRAFEDKSWWKYVQYASDVAILLIVVHSLRLGSQLQTGWYKTVWLFYTVTLVLAIGYIYYQKANSQKTPTE